MSYAIAKKQLTFITVKILLSALTLFVIGSGILIPNTAFSAEFPVKKTEDSTKNILRSYVDYLQFVVDIGNQVNHKDSVKLASLYEKIRKNSPDAAAKFLKGLRFELIQKTEIMGVSSKNLNSSNVELRRMVSRYLGLWTRELDEQWFRAKTNKLI